jgi:TetR/AcrR family transcriptional regulator, transcriptional repressor for nem operon
MTRVPRGEARVRLLEAARALVRRKGFAGTSVDELCTAAGVTKGAFFHHFASKEALGVALIDDYNSLPDPLDRVFAYIALRREILCQPVEEFSCVAGTTVQEAYETAPPIREAAERSIESGCDHVRRHLDEALAAHPVPGVSADSLARLFQVAVQGGIILAKADGTADPAREAFDHLERYLRLLFGRGT